jgi:hypothetical protein
VFSRLLAGNIGAQREVLDGIIKTHFKPLKHVTMKLKELKKALNRLSGCLKI